MQVHKRRLKSNDLRVYTQGQKRRQEPTSRRTKLSIEQKRSPNTRRGAMTSGLWKVLQRVRDLVGGCTIRGVGRRHYRRQSVHIVGREEARGACGWNPATPPILVLLSQHFNHITTMEGKLFRLGGVKIKARDYSLHHLRLLITAPQAQWLLIKIQVDHHCFTVKLPRTHTQYAHIIAPKHLKG